MPQIANRIGVQYDFLRGGQKFFLPTFPNAVVALSLQNLNGISSSDVVRVRRSSDNAESDFNANEVKGSALLDYVVPTDVQALYSNRMYFDGVDDQVQIPTTTDYSFGTNDFSVAITIVPFDNGNAWAAAIQNNNPVSQSNGWALYTRTAGDNKFGFRFRNTVPGVDDTTSPTEWVEGQKYRVLYTKSGTTAKLYVDGVEVVSDTVSSELEAINSHLQIGIGNTRSEAVLSDARIFNRALTPAEALSDSNNTDAVTSGLISSWDGYGNTNADWEDQVGSNDGTVNGSPALFTGQGFNGAVSTWYDQNVPTSKDVMYFDGVDDYVDITQIDLTGPYTISFSYVADTAQTMVFLGRQDQDNFSYIAIVSNGSLFWESNTNNDSIQCDSGTFPFDGEVHDVVLNISAGGVPSGTIDGVAINFSGTFTDNTLSISRIGGRQTSTPLEGSIFDVNIDDVASYNGYGNTNEAWEDQIGSNNGTVNGNPKRLSSIDYSTISNDAIQTTAGEQPLIVENGALITENGKPAIKFGSTTIELLSIAGQSSATSSEETFFAVSKWDIGGTNPTLLGSDDNTYRVYGFAVTELVFVAGGFSGSDSVDYGTNLSSQGLLTGIRNNTSGYIKGWINGTLADEETGYTTDLTEQISAIGARGDGEQSWGGTIQEVILFSTDQSSEREAIEANINKRYNIY